MLSQIPHLKTLCRFGSVILLAACSRVLGAEPEAEKKDSDPRQTVGGRKLGYTLKLPRGWKAVKTGLFQGPGVSLDHPIMPPSPHHATIAISWSDYKGGPSLAYYAHIRPLRVDAQTPWVKHVHPAGDTKARTADYHVHTTSHRVRYVLISTSSGELLVEQSTLVELWDRTLPVFDKILRSVHDVPAAPGEQIRALPVARLAQVIGWTRYARCRMGKWIQAVEGLHLRAGDRLDTRAGIGMARLNLGGKARVYVNRKTLLRLLCLRTETGMTPLVELTEGEIYVDGRGENVRVATPDVLVSARNSRFTLRRPAIKTIVAVRSGWVEVRARPISPDNEGRFTFGDVRSPRSVTNPKTWELAPVRVESQEQTLVRRGWPPTDPMKMDWAPMPTWVRAMGAGKAE